MLNVKRFTVIALVLLVVGAIGALFTAQSVTGTDETETIEFRDETYDDIVIEADNVQVEVVPATTEGTMIEFIGNTASDQRYDVQANVKENRLSVSVEEEWFKLFNFDFSFSTPTLMVYVPEKAYETIQLDTVNGRVEVRGLEGNEMQITTDNGRAAARDLDVNELQATTDNGQIELKEIRSNSVTSEADNGEIRMENVEGELSGKTTNGQIKLKTEHMDRPIDLHTDNGRIHIQTENEPTNATLDVNINNGKVTIFGKSNWDTIIGEGENLIKLTVHNGKITVEK